MAVVGRGQMSLEAGTLVGRMLKSRQGDPGGLDKGQQVRWKRVGRCDSYSGGGIHRIC